MHTKIPMFDKFLTHAWSRCGGLIEEHSISATKLILACQEVLVDNLKMVSRSRVKVGVALRHTYLNVTPLLADLVGCLEAKERRQGAQVLERVPPYDRLRRHHPHHRQYFRRPQTPGTARIRVTLERSVPSRARHLRRRLRRCGGSHLVPLVPATTAAGSPEARRHRQRPLR